MKDSIYIVEVQSLDFINKTVFEVELGIDFFLIGDQFTNSEKSLQFKLIGIGTENMPRQKTVLFTVEPSGDYQDLKEFEGLYFQRKEKI